MKNKILISSLFILTFLTTSLAAGQFLVLKHPLVGKAAPDFSLPALNGGSKTLAEIRQGKNTIVFFWTTWCPHCRSQLNSFALKRESIEEKGVALVLINLQEPPETVKQFLKGSQLEDICLVDSKAEVAKQYSIQGVPTFFFISADGTVKAVENILPPEYEGYFK